VKLAVMNPSVSTISKLVLHPEVPGIEPSSFNKELARWKRYHVNFLLKKANRLYNLFGQCLGFST